MSVNQKCALFIVDLLIKYSIVIRAHFQRDPLAGEFKLHIICSMYVYVYKKTGLTKPHLKSLISVLTLCRRVSINYKLFTEQREHTKWFLTGE